MFSQMQTIIQEHQPRSIPKVFKTKYQHCMVCSMEEYIMNRLVGSAKTKGRRKWARRRGHLASCSKANCNIIAHTCAPDGTKLGMMPRVLGMNCFEIAHTPDVQNLFTCVHRKGKSYLRSIPSHPVYEELIEAYTQDIPRQSHRLQPSGRSRAGRPRRPSVSSISSTTDSQSSEDERPPQKKSRHASPTPVYKSYSWRSSINSKT